MELWFITIGDESWDHGVAGSCANRVLIGAVSSSRDHAVAQHYGNDLINMQRTAHTMLGVLLNKVRGHQPLEA